MKVKISTTNSKMGKIPNVSLPPIKTCRCDAPCRVGCYATKGHFSYKNVRNAYQSNLDLYQSNPKAFFEEIIWYLSSPEGNPYFRWHTAGDIVDEQYFKGVVDVALAVPKTSFLLFTKKFEIVNAFAEFNEIPPNLHVVFSAWGDFIPQNPHNFPMAFVRFPKEKHYIPVDAAPCAGDCTNCLTCWSAKPGESVVFKKH